jgi:predicted metal-dependent phosphoesterase TrpH
MNHSLLSADRNTHLKIVAVALAAAIGVVAVGITAHVTGTGIATARIDATVPILKAGQPAVYTRSDNSTIR